MLQPTSLAETSARSLPAKVLIVDDSVVARGLFSRWVDERPGLSVVGTASDGKGAVRSAASLQPDIVILDLDMPIMDGLTALPEILKASPGSAVIVASSLTARSARLSMQCLALGAVDVQPKPESNRDITMSLSFRQELIGKLEGLIETTRRNRRNAVSADGRREGPSGQAEGGRSMRPSLRFEVTPRILLMGASTGGPRAVLDFLVNLGPAAQRLPIVIAQHMPALFTTSFAEQLHAHLKRPVREAIHGEAPMPGMIYVAPGGRHLRIEKEPAPRLMLDDGDPVRFCRPSVDLLFGDAAAVYGASALAVVLTGMGSDGLNGARALREAGACILVQDEASSVVWGMPGAVRRAGLAHEALPPDVMGSVVGVALSSGGRP
jgi:two-component system chemotaxis response regulator CheB